MKLAELTRAQEDILKIIWDLREGAISDVLNELPEPKPAYTTVATVIKVLEKKGYLTHKTYGKTNVYYPLVSKKDYAGNIMHSTLKGLFNGSVNQLVSHFIKDKDLDIHELEAMKKMLEEEINNQKK
ncbi:BlaI/MecI/CopY family transcriptional regulator [Robertkochia aurantiaca]|uniref:BlaI/MecI/CopY family transcriptional regulator n=1 Tax=Robertkochia aurantiaca TaxID=2873700 RepID=UPI001CCC923B|nr:BlaI/MecI/CopY family transcriptional regulator [Robertkochia sp. 3YJGBD-33]